ncbi:MAG: hypothetical protein K0R92_2005 [Lachnospiraceae bacterium]|jgi:predicted oxidoreductase (fatty acid repression mutant protein)|nr:hypothetical protein [Lachnospiraceae bacterium]
MSKNFNAAVAERRTYYGISKEAVVADDKLIEIIEHSVKHTPSAFNSQGARVVILLGEKHDRLWNITEDALRKVVPADQFASTEEKIISFRNGYGTILYFEDQSVIKGLQEQFALYKDNFPVWAQQSNGMLQFVIWTAIEAEGYGASLQHYAELIEADVRAEWNIPDNWKMIAQMPFGKPVNPPQEKVYQPLDSRVRIIQ